METKSNLINLDWDFTLSEKPSENFMAHKANYTTLMVFFNLATCLLKCEGILVKIKKKPVESVPLSQNTNIRNKTYM